VSDLAGYPLFRRGKVRDTYDLGTTLLIVASDRVSAFDTVLPNPVPRKGMILTQLSRFWFDQTRHVVPNHLITGNVDDFPLESAAYRLQLVGRAMLVRKAERIDIECVVRGYLDGSAWAEYRNRGTIAGDPAPSGLRQGEKLARPLFTPAVKHDQGHDVTVSPKRLASIVGADLARRLEEISLMLYATGSEIALRRGIIVADTKFEFGFVEGKLTLIDELLTPDSSRFWEASQHQPGGPQPSFDKQFVRDWLEGSGWDKQPPAPELPAAIVADTAARYAEAYKRLTGSPLLVAPRDREGDKHEVWVTP
jgi:phosphoribosylaminoimidazole-succinocarboxamide synthase